MRKARTICPKPGCPNIVVRRYCADHERQYERQRGTATQRGYGKEHQSERERWAPLVDRGMVACAKCHTLIRPGTPWDLGHTGDRKAWTGPEHAACNRSAGGQTAHQFER
jgi:hypothetical protein